jgi:hypothetical protein
MNKGNDNSSRARKTPSKSFSQFLKESDIKPLVFLGKCWQFFGPKCVIVFFLGVIIVTIYLYVFAINNNRLPLINKFEVTNHAPVLSGVPTTTVYLNVEEKLIFVAKAHDDDKNLKEFPFSLKDHDGSGMIIDSKSGIVDWTMKSGGTYKITVIAKDEYDATDYKNFTVTDQKDITISGYVKIKEGNDMKLFSEPFEVGILENRGGPFNRTIENVGLFSIEEVPFLKKYDIVVWRTDSKLFTVYYGVEIKRYGDEYCLIGDLKFSD